MLRKNLLLAVLSLLPLSGFSLGLGDITVETHLNEPLMASIDLTGTVDLTENEILINLADEESFKRAGATRDFYLTQMRFSVDLKSETPKIFITTQGPVREPFLNFLVEIQWPGGTIMKEYTVFFNPS